jgi:hypothetical protein
MTGWRPSVAQVVLCNPPSPNAEPGLWSQWCHDLHRLIGMAQARMTTLGHLGVISRTTPSDIIDRVRGLTYLMAHPMRLVAVVSIITTYHVVVDHTTTLDIMTLQISHTLLIHVSGMAMPSLLCADPLWRRMQA